jgi:CheY-like chemotaxis protein
MSDQKRLLVVDDHVEITDLIREIAETEGYDVHALNQSSQFFDQFEKIDPDVVCIDIHMPDVDGIEILRWLSSHGSSARIIILSGGDPLFTKVAERIGEAAKRRIFISARSSNHSASVSFARCCGELPLRKKMLPDTASDRCVKQP